MLFRAFGTKKKNKNWKLILLEFLVNTSLWIWKKIEISFFEGKCTCYLKDQFYLKLENSEIPWIFGSQDKKPVNIKSKYYFQGPLNIYCWEIF